MIALISGLWEEAGRGCLYLPLTNGAEASKWNSGVLPFQHQQLSMHALLFPSHESRYHGAGFASSCSHGEAIAPVSQPPPPRQLSSASPLPQTIISSIITVLSSCIRLNFCPQWLGQPTSFKTACHNNDRIVIIHPAAMRASSCPVHSHMAPQSFVPHSTPASRPSASICSIWWCGIKGEFHLCSSSQCTT